LGKNKPKGKPGRPKKKWRANTNTKKPILILG
jgi:hypothetical protein